MPQIKPDFTRVFASNAGASQILDPDDWQTGKFQDGWEFEEPHYQHMNFVQNYLSRAVSYFNEQGIAEWDSGTQYPARAYVKGDDGDIYRAKQSSVNINPTTDNGTNWEFYNRGDVDKWNTNLTYAVDDYVKGDDGNLYNALVVNSGINPTTDDGSTWENKTAGGLTGVAVYEDGSLVDEFQGLDFSLNFDLVDNLDGTVSVLHNSAEDMNFNDNVNINFGSANGRLGSISSLLELHHDDQIILSTSANNSYFSIGSAGIPFAHMSLNGDLIFQGTHDGTNSTASIKHNGDDRIVVDNNIDLTPGASGTINAISTLNQMYSSTGGSVWLEHGPSTANSILLRQNSSNDARVYIGNTNNHVTSRVVGGTTQRLSITTQPFSSANFSEFHIGTREPGAGAAENSKILIGISDRAAFDETVVVPFMEVQADESVNVYGAFFGATPVQQQTFDSSDTDANRIAALEALIAAYGLGVDIAP